jgi:hypothetical protein
MVFVEFVDCFNQELLSVVLSSLGIFFFLSSISLSTLSESLSAGDVSFAGVNSHLKPFEQHQEAWMVS